MVSRIDEAQLLAPLLNGFLPALLPAGDGQALGLARHRRAVGGGAADAFKLLELQPEVRQLAGAGQQDVGREADLGGGDGQDAGLAGPFGAKTADDVMDVMGGGDALGQPLPVALDRARTKELGVVAELEDQAGVLPSQGSSGERLSCTMGGSRGG